MLFFNLLWFIGSGFYSFINMGNETLVSEVAVFIIYMNCVREFEVFFMIKTDFELGMR